MKSAEITLKKQIWSVFWTHLYTIGISIVFGLGAFWWFLAQPVWQKVYSVIFMIIYFVALYMKGHKIAAHDLKGYAQTKAYPAKGIFFGLLISLSTFILWIGYRLVWIGSPDGLMGVWKSMYNGLFIFYTFIYNGIMVPYKGGIFWYSHIVMYALPVAALGIGYFAGFKGINIYEKLLPFMYEKKDD